IVATSPVTAQAYHDRVDLGSVLTVHSALADIGKDLRLLSEVLLGVWLAVAGRQLRHRTGNRAWWTLTALGGLTFAVAVWKLLEPEMPAEDYLGFVLGVAYVVMGVAFLRRGSAG